MCAQPQTAKQYENGLAKSKVEKDPAALGAHPRELLDE
jgi:hypothetical protein